MSAVDPVFGINAFGEQKVLNESETKVNNILTILFMRPGSYPSLPELGVYIQQYLYKPIDDINCEEIKAKITSQCNDFIDDVESGTLDVLKTVYDNQPMLLVVLPVKIKEEVTGLVIGITVSTIGDLTYNIAYDKNALS